MTIDLLDAYTIIFLDDVESAMAEPLAGIIDGDCIERMAAMPDASVDAIVTDPPYDLTSGKRGGSGAASVNLDSPYGRARIGVGNGPGGFMGKAWDGTGIAFDPATWREALRVLKPGGYVLAFGGTRTYHRLACAIEDAGFEIRDTLCWLYGSGFPKSLDVSKAIDKAAGAERDETRIATRAGNAERRGEGEQGATYGDGHGGFTIMSAPATPDAERWNGWGTALKPAHEPIVLARKPLAGTVAGNVLAHGTGALNVDGCRVGTEPAYVDRPRGPASPLIAQLDGQGTTSTGGEGRWPANVVLDPDAATMLDAQDDASRFFYIAKASRAERNAGLDGFETRPAGIKNASGRGYSERDPYAVIRMRNTHPTVKPIELMRWLVRLVTPPGGLVLDPFTGSGTTGIACALEGLEFVGFEREPEYADIARARLAWWQRQPRAVEVAEALAAEADRERVRATGQMELVP